MNDLRNLVREAMARPTLDSTAEDKPSKRERQLKGAAAHTDNEIKLKALGVLHQWAENEDLDNGETNSDRLMALFIGIADENKDGEISNDEQDLVDVALNAAWDYLAQKGVDDDDLDLLLNEWDDDAGDRIRDLLAASLPDGEAAADEIDDFVFGDDDQEPVFDAVYKKKIVIRGGKKVRINKRVSGNVRLSAKQKVGLRKARIKSHSAGAQMKRKKSLRMRSKMNLK